MKNKKKYILLTICLILACCLALFIQAWRAGWEKMMQMDCQGNIKSIMVCLHMYAEKNDGWFPDKSGVQGLEMLKKEVWDEAYLKNAPYLFNCPSVKPAKEYSISYDYVGGYRIDSDKDIGIVMDKVGNHKDYGNIGFVDGRVLPFDGKDWRKNAKPASAKP